MNKILFVIAPDKASGKAFNSKLIKNNLETTLEFFTIEKRVLKNQINTSEKVTLDLEEAIKIASLKSSEIVIACNTLQFWVPKIDKSLLENIKIYTTFEACEWKYKDQAKKPVWLGTTPTATLIKSFPTLLSMNLMFIQDLFQEITWRVKMLNGDDYSGASDIVKKDSGNIVEQKKKLEILKSLTIKYLQEEGIKNVILGCTEYPVLFTEPTLNGIKIVDAAQVLAEYVIFNRRASN